MKIYNNNKLNFDIIKGILDTYYFSTDISVFFINDLRNVLCSSNDKARFCKIFEDHMRYVPLFTIPFICE